MSFEGFFKLLWLDILFALIAVGLIWLGYFALKRLLSADGQKTLKTLAKWTTLTIAVLLVIVILIFAGGNLIPRAVIDRTHLDKSNNELQQPRVK